MSAPKSITDPLYGSIALTETEAKIVSSRTFQRLHNVRQLGMAHLVFPSAGYSRFAHSVGACNNASKMIDAIGDNTGQKLPDDRKAAYRVAALLHDVGHYPFSHTTEHTLSNYYAGSLFEGSLIKGTDHNSESVNHEDVGGLILSHDPEISQIIKTSSDISLELLSGIFSKALPDPLFGVISSELDCDRLDYLARTSHLSGVPYGRIDADFIMGKATLGAEGELAFDAKAARAIDHLLIARYYDYMQMVYHKTVEALEWSLSEAIKFAIEQKQGLMSKTDVEQRITNGTWWRTDDNWLIGKFKRLEDRLGNSPNIGPVCDHLKAILYRRPAKRVWKWEALKPRDDKEISLRKKLAQAVANEVADHLGIDRARFWVSERRFKVANLSHLDVKQDSFSEELARSIRVLGRRGANYLVEDESLIMHHLSQMRNFAVNIYYLPQENENKTVREEVREALHQRMAAN